MRRTAPDSRNVVWQANPLSRTQHAQRNGHRGLVVWLTGLPGAGKSSIASQVHVALHHRGWHTVLLDGDNLRHGLCADLGFSVDDRNEQVRRTGALARLLMEQGQVVLAALVSPMRAARDQLRQSMAPGDFVEVWCRCPVAVCAERDPKGLYDKARRGLIADFTGVSSPYEEPLQATLVLDTASQPLDVSVHQVLAHLNKGRYHSNFSPR